MDNFFKARGRLEKLLGRENVLSDEINAALFSFDCGLSRARPAAVLKITRCGLVSPVLKILHEYKIPFTARAAATNHVGGCVTLKGGVVLNLMPLNKIIKIDTLNNFAEVECGVITADLQEELDPLGYVYQPDPASRKICTLGGNAALNAGGMKCLKYGATKDHILKIQFVTPEGGELILSKENAGPDLAGLVTGSEGTLGVITKLRVKIQKKPAHIKTMLAAFNGVDDAVECVSDIMSSGVTPRCVEAMDKLTVSAVEAYAESGYPKDCAALLLIETDGEIKKAESDMQAVRRICEKHKAYKITVAGSEEARQALWRGRNGGYAAMARVAPNVFVEDGTVPRSELPSAVKKSREICEKYNVEAGLFFHAGDGNLHPNIVFDQRSPAQTNDVVKAGKEILKLCADLGGTISGEHGIGIEKRSAMSFMYGVNELELFKKIKKVFDPENISNPDKIFPIATDCVKKEKEVSPLILTLADKIRTGKKIEPDVKNLNRVLETDTKNYVMTVEAGIKTEDIKKELSSKGLHAALPQYDGSVGELFSGGQCGDFAVTVTGLQAVLAGGEIINYGGKFVKNSAGYNLAALFAGAKGAYGILTKLTFRIFKEPRPARIISKTKTDLTYALKLKKALDPQKKFGGFDD